MKKTTEKYFCDLCKKEYKIEPSRHISIYQIVYNVYPLHENNSAVDICPKCEIAISKVLATLINL